MKIVGCKESLTYLQAQLQSARWACHSSKLGTRPEPSKPAPQSGGDEYYYDGKGGGRLLKGAAPTKHKSPSEVEIEPVPEKKTKGSAGKDYLADAYYAYYGYYGYYEHGPT